MKSQRLVALLPIKAHSERVPGKNFKLFSGRPLYQWILDTLLEIKAIDLVVINTDARELFIKSGMNSSDRILLRDRRPEICGDFVSMNKVLADDIENVEATAYLMTHATNPNLSAHTIDRAIGAYLEGSSRGDCDSLFSVNKFQARFYKKDGSAVNHDPQKLIRTQDLEPWFLENSCLYLFSRSSFQKTQARIGSRPLIFETPLADSIDIDDQETWEVAEAIAFARQSMTKR